MSKTALCGRTSFSSQVCCMFVRQTKSAFPELTFSPLSRRVFFVCTPRLLTLWQAESRSIVREEWLFVVPTCCHCGFDCLSRQHGLGHNHSHTATPVDGHSFWQGSQMVLQVLCGLQQSEWVIDPVSERPSTITTKREGWRLFALISVLSSVQPASKKGENPSLSLWKLCQGG